MSTQPYQLMHLNLPVLDIDRSLDFYVTKLGFDYVRHLHKTKVILSICGFDFFLEQFSSNVSNPIFHFGIKTTTQGVYDFSALLERAGIGMVIGPQPTGKAEIYVTPDQLRAVFYFSDPDGHIIEVYSHIGVDVGYVKSDPWSKCQD